MTSTATDEAAQTPVWRRWHAALMPDYNRKATLYWCAVVAGGAGVLALALMRLSGSPLQIWLQVALGMAIAMLAGCFPVRIPHSKNSFAAGEIFIFLLLLMLGPVAATLAAAGETLVGAWRTHDGAARAP